MTAALPTRWCRSLVAGAAACLLMAALVAPVGAAQGDGASSDAMPAHESSTSDLAPGDPATITFTGGGWGHGAGMSQFGVYGRAAAGKSYRAILRFYYQNTVIGTSDYRGNVAVHVGTRSPAVFEPRGRVELRLNNVVKAQARNGQQVRVSRAGGEWSLKVNGVERCDRGCGGGSFALTYADGTVVAVPGVGTYDHGKIKLVPTSGGQLDVVVAGLTMQEYLYGLAEMPSSWPAEALKVQAVAGRSFAQFNIERRRADPNWNRPYDLSGSTGDQVYAGWAKSAGAFGEQWMAAVDATEGQISTYQGEPIQAFYSSSHGGHSENSEYVFQTALPYIRARADKFDGHENRFHQWTRTYSIADLSRWLSRYGAGTIESIAITGNIGVSGRVNRATVVLTGSNGTREITGNQLRWRINEGVGSSLDRQLLSTKFTVSETKPPDAAPVGRFAFANLVTSGPRARASLRGWALDPDTADSIRVYLTDNGKWSGGQVANDSRPAIERKYGLGDRHGFKIKHPLTPGVHELCINARNHPDATGVPVQCRTVRVGNSPTGALTDITSSASDALPYQAATMTIRGTANDRDTSRAVAVALDLDGTPATASAVAGRFSTTVTAEPGPTQVCGTAIDDSGLRPDADLGCLSHDVIDRPPVGKFRVSSPAAGRVRLRGWALDPDSDASVTVTLQVDGTETATARAADDRPTVATKYGRGAAHGYDLEATVTPGTHRFCVLATDATNPGGPRTTTMCRTKTVA